MYIKEAVFETNLILNQFINSGLEIDLDIEIET